MTENFFLFYLLISVAACLYAMVGHGGASAYLAIMALFNMATTEIRSIALVLNILVSAIAFYQFYRQQLFDKKIFLFLCLTSIPASYIGGSILLTADLYKQLLGIALFITALRFLWPLHTDLLIQKQANPIVLLFIGAIIGFISGLIGIGGGVLLSPILILLGYANMKTAAGISALFIFVNSIAGLLGQSNKPIQWDISVVNMLVAAFAGGLIGAHIGSKRIESQKLKKVLAFVLIIASAKLLIP